jgi:hypothetical protein
MIMNDKTGRNVGVIMGYFNLYRMEFLMPFCTQKLYCKYHQIIGTWQPHSEALFIWGPDSPLCEGKLCLNAQITSQYRCKQRQIKMLTATKEAICPL